MADEEQQPITPMQALQSLFELIMNNVPLVERQRATVIALRNVVGAALPVELPPPDETPAAEANGKVARKAKPRKAAPPRNRASTTAPVGK